MLAYRTDAVARSRGRLRPVRPAEPPTRGRRTSATATRSCPSRPLRGSSPASRQVRPAGRGARRDRARAPAARSATSSTDAASPPSRRTPRASTTHGCRRRVRHRCTRPPTSNASPATIGSRSIGASSPARPMPMRGPVCSAPARRPPTRGRTGHCRCHRSATPTTSSAAAGEAEAAEPVRRGLSTMLEAAFWGSSPAVALVIGAAIGVWIRTSRAASSPLVMGFGAGALISCAGLRPDRGGFRDRRHRRRRRSGWRLGGRHVLRRRPDPRAERRPQRRARSPTTGGAGDRARRPARRHPRVDRPRASLLGGLGVSVSFLAAVFVSNLPEGLAGARDLPRRRPTARRRIIGAVGRRSRSRRAIAAGLGYAVARRHDARSRGGRPGLRRRARS